jgi:hypothetical protein
MFNKLNNADSISMYNGTLVFSSNEEIDTDVYFEAGQINMD